MRAQVRGLPRGMIGGIQHSMSGQHAELLAKNRYQRRIKRLCQRYYQRQLDRMKERMRSGSESQGEGSVKAEGKE